MTLLRTLMLALAASFLLAQDSKVDPKAELNDELLAATRKGDLVLVAVDAGRLGAALRYEPSRGGAMFPHLYGKLPLSTVRWVKPLPLGPEGRHEFPEIEP